MFKNILVCLDGSPHSDEALTVAIELASVNDGAIELITVAREPYAWIVGAPMTPVPQFADLRNLIEQEHKRVLNDAGAKVPAGVAVSAALVFGDPAAEIVKQANGGDIDLVVMGARGLGGVKSALLGSVSQRVLHRSEVPVLIAHAKQDAVDAFQAAAEVARGADDD